MKLSKMKSKRIISLFLALILLTLPVTGFTDGEENREEENDLTGKIVVSLANDITASQQETILDIFGITLDAQDVQFITTTIEEEYEYLGDIAGPEIIGSRTISSAYLEILPEGEGITVRTHNITWVTKEMYTSALVTAGVNDAEIFAAAPTPVSGTGALTGVLKAFEEATGEKLPEENKKVAHEELVILQELTEDQEEEQDRINQLIQEAKEEILTRRPLEADEIEQIIRRLAEELEIDLSDEQVNRITNFLLKFNNINVDLDQLRDQIERLADDPAIRSFFISVFDQISEWVKDILEMLRGK